MSLVPETGFLHNPVKIAPSGDSSYVLGNPNQTNFIYLESQLVVIVNHVAGLCAGSIYFFHNSWYIYLLVLKGLFV